MSNRITQNVKCRLCKKSCDLIQSHIIPEYFYDTIYDDDHKLFMIPAKQNKRIDIEQKGIRERLLCNKCDNYFSPFENYGKSLIFGGKLNTKLIENTKDYLIVEGVDYCKFKLLQLSILWRASISKHPFFSIVDLGPHEAKIREMLFAADPGKYYEYGCIMFALLDGNEIWDMFSSPRKYYAENHRCYRFVFGGFAWNFVVSGNSNEISLKEFMLQENGRHPIIKQEVANTDFIQKEAKWIKARYKDMMRFVK